MRNKCYPSTTSATALATAKRALNAHKVAGTALQRRINTAKAEAERLKRQASGESCSRIVDAIESVFNDIEGAWNSIKSGLNSIFCLLLEVALGVMAEAGDETMASISPGPGPVLRAMQAMPWCSDRDSDAVTRRVIMSHMNDFTTYLRAGLGLVELDAGDETRLMIGDSSVPTWQLIGNGACRDGSGKHMARNGI